MGGGLGSSGPCRDERKSARLGELLANTYIHIHTYIHTHTRTTAAQTFIQHY